MKNLRFIIPLAVLWLCIGLLWWNSGPEPGTALYEAYATYGFRSLDDDVATTELYTYRLEHPSSEQSYRFVGNPLRFSFPKKYYFFSSNIKGGPQRLISLAVDAKTLRATTDDIKECCGAKTLTDVIKSVQKHSRDNVIIEIGSREGPIPQGAEREIINFFESPHVSQKEPIGKTCNYLMYNSTWKNGGAVENYYRKQNSKMGKKIIADGLDLYDQNYFGIRKLDDSRYQTLHCSIEADGCINGVTYKDHLVKIFVKKELVCQYPDLGTRIINFLDDYRVGGVGSAGPAIK